MMEAVGTSETSAIFYQTAGHNNTREGSHVNISRRENLRSHPLFFYPAFPPYVMLIKSVVPPQHSHRQLRDAPVP
jgi:hypothetical protein